MALANVDGYHTVFQTPVASADGGDLPIAVSAGGESANIVAAVAVGQSAGAGLV